MKSIRSLIFSFAIALQAIFVGSFSARAAAPLKLEEAIIVPDSKGGFDYLQVDDAKRRLLANHTGNNTLDVFDVDSGKLTKQVKTGKAQGGGGDAEGGKYYGRGSRGEGMVIVESDVLEKPGEGK